MILLELCKGRNIGPSPALARDAQAGPARPVSDGLSEFSVRSDPSLFFSPSTKTAYATVSAIKMLQFCIKWQSDCISFRYFNSLVNLERRLDGALFLFVKCKFLFF